VVTLISGRFTAWARTHGNYWIQGWENSRATAHAVAKKSNPASLKGCTVAQPRIRLLERKAALLGEST